MFLKLFKFIHEALLELNWSYMLDILSILKCTEGSPECTRASKLAIEVLSRRNDTVLYSANLTLEYMQKKIADSTSNIFSEFT
jgi:hypothetical protein